MASSDPGPPPAAEASVPEPESDSPPDPESQDFEPQPPRPEVPVEHVLHDQQGRELPVRILERSPDKIRMARLADGQEFIYAIVDLSAEDQEFVRTIRVTGSKIESQTPGAPGTGSDRYISSRQEEIEKLMKEKEDLEFEIAKGGLTGPQKRQRKTQVEVIDKEIEKLKEQIRIHKQ